MDSEKPFKGLSAFSRYSFGLILLPTSSSNFSEKSRNTHRKEGKDSNISFWTSSSAF